MALHAPLTAFLARLNTDLGAGTGAEFLAATGRRLYIVGKSSELLTRTAM